MTVTWVSKEELDRQQEAELAAFARALGHPIRVRILRILSAQGNCLCGDLASQLPVAQSTVSQHLKVLRNVGLIEGEVDGPKRCYCLNTEVLGRAKRLMRAL